MNKKVLIPILIGSCAIASFFGYGYLNKLANDRAPVSEAIDISEAKLTSTGTALESKILDLSKKYNLSQDEISNQTLLGFTSNNDNDIYSYKSMIDLPLENISDKAHFSVDITLNSSVNNPTIVLNNSFISDVTDLITNQKVDFSNINKKLNKYIAKNNPNFANKKLKIDMTVGDYKIELRNNSDNSISYRVY